MTTPSPTGRVSDREAPTPLAALLDEAVQTMLTEEERTRVEAAVLKEREANAYIAESFAPPDDTYPVTPHGVGVGIAKAIRARSKP
jgi:hypothetical protein